jgi:hypothetical protein
MALAALALLALVQTEEVGRNFRVVFHGRETANARRLVEALDAGYPRVTELLGVSPREPGPYAVHVFESADDYRRKDQELNQGRFANNGAFAHRATQTAYVQFQPRPGVGLFERMEALVFHESFHLVTYRHAPWVSSGPPWLYEGLAERAAEVCMRRGETDSFKFGDPANLARALLERSGWIPLGDLLATDRSSDADFLTRWAWYAECWLLVKYLCERQPEAWGRFRSAMAASKETDAARARALLLEATGMGSDALEAAWIEWIRGLAPAPWRLLDGDWRLREGGGIEGAAFERLNALAVSTERVGAARYSVTARVRIHDGVGPGQADLALVAAWDLRGTHLWKACVTREGVCAILERKGATWRRLALERAEIKPDGEGWLDLELEVDGGKLRLKVGGVARVEHAFTGPESDLADVHWAVGCHDSRVEFASPRLKR